MVAPTSDPSIPPLSMVISTTQGFAVIHRHLATVEAAAERVGAQVLVGDGSPHEPPGSDVLGPSTLWFSRPGASVFQLRGESYRMTKAPVVAVTEDHCLVPPDWGERVLSSHASHPEAMAIGGSVENAATSTLMDWASFFALQTRFMSPIKSGPTSQINGHVNISYKREALAVIDDFDGLGALDSAHQDALHDRGLTILSDDTIRCAHDQSLGGVGTSLAHFHAGRAVAGFRRARMDGRTRGRASAVFVVPFFRVARVAVIGMSKSHRGRLLLSLPLIWWLLMCQAAGQFVGYVAGPGQSPRNVI